MVKTIPDTLVAVTASNTAYITDFSGQRTHGSLYIGVSGDVVALPNAHADTDTATPALGGAVLYKNVAVGPFPYDVKKVFATGTTATNILCAIDK